MTIPFGQRFSLLSARGHRFPNPSLEVDLQPPISMQDVMSSHGQTIKNGILYPAAVEKLTFQHSCAI